jgi:hypothetical protein
MILIAHRGNLNGPKPELENNILYIEDAIDQGYQVEVDLRMKDGEFYFGHDEPQYRVSEEFLIRNKSYLWIHCKDHESFNTMLNMGTNNSFWHDTDDYVLTKYGYVWAYPGKPPVGRSCIMVMPELHWSIEDIKKMKCFGICSDYVKLLNT